MLERLAAGQATALVVTTADRAARTNAVHRLDYYTTREGWRLLILDALDRDTSPKEKLLHGIRVNVAEYERELIARRTRRVALAHQKAQGVRLSPPRRCPDELLDRVLELRGAGQAYRGMAELLKRDGVATPADTGTHWHGSSVYRLCHTHDARHWPDSRGKVPNPAHGHQ